MTAELVFDEVQILHCFHTLSGKKRRLHAALRSLVPARVSSPVAIAGPHSGGQSGWK